MMEQKQNGKENKLDIKLIALDIDGTLLNNEKKISIRNERALDNALEKGINIVPATGRPLSGLPKELINKSKIQYAICSNGATIINLKSKQVIYYCELSKEKVKSIIELLKVLDPILDVFTDGKIITEKRNIYRIDEFLIPSNMKQYIYDTRVCVDNIIDYIIDEAKHIEKINLFFKNINQREAVSKKLLNIEGIGITSSLNNNMEINNEKANKGQGLLWLSKYLGLEKKQLMACGDSDNDLSMLKVAGTGVAMENATDEIKKAAKIISLSNDKDGVAEVIEKYIF